MLFGLRVLCPAGGPGARATVAAGALAALSICPAPALGADRLHHFLSLSLDELMAQKVTISTQTAQPLRLAPSAVTVISADDIRATGAGNLVEMLQGVPGIHVSHSPFGFRPLIHFRGANDKQTLLMIDGAPVSDLMWRLGIFWKGLPTSIIDRVEIIRGPGSALFGTDASAGVINVITKAAGVIEQPEAGIRVGSFDTRSAWVQHGGAWNGFDLAVSLDLATTDGHDPLIRSDAQTHNDDAFGTRASLAPGRAGFGWQNADLRLAIAKGDWRLQAGYMRHADLETGMTGAGALDPLTEAEDTRLSLDLLYADADFSEDWGVDAELRYRHIDDSSADGFQEWPPGFVDDGGLYPDGVINRMRSAERSVIAEASGLYRGIEGHQLRIGGGFRWQDIYRVEQFLNAGVDRDGEPLPPGGPLVDISDSPFAFAPEKSRTIRYLYLQDVWRLAQDWELTAGARYDHHSDFGGALTPRLALVWQTDDRLTTKLMYGRAFRAPYFQELFAETSFSLPNAGLDPERSETWELSFSLQADEDLQLGMNLYHLQQTDLITLQTMPGLAKRQYQNFGEHSIRGVELETRWQATSAIRLAANYSLQDADDDRYREVRSPARQAYLRADWQFGPGWNWNMQANWIGERKRSADDPRPALDDYLVTDSTLRYVGRKGWDFALSLRNMFDTDARDHTRFSIENDLPLAGRHLYVEARYELDRLLK